MGNPFCPNCKTHMVSKLKTWTDHNPMKFKSHFNAHHIWKCPRCKTETKR